MALIQVAGITNYTDCTVTNHTSCTADLTASCIANLNFYNIANRLGCYTDCIDCRTGFNFDINPVDNLTNHCNLSFSYDNSTVDFSHSFNCSSYLDMFAKSFCFTHL